MKPCPFCKEEIRDDAIKCRYCQSMLLPVQPTDASPHEPSESGRVTYVLDRDLVRFAKFAGAVLTIFVVVGAYFFGFKLDSALEKVRDTQEKLVTAQRDLEEAQKTVSTLKVQVEDVLTQAKGRLGEITASREEAAAIVVSIRQLTEDEEASLETAKTEKTEKARTEANSKFWKPGATIRIRFLDGDAQAQSAVKTIATEWTKYANLQFEFTTAQDAEIRVSFKQPGWWSYRGTDALAIPSREPTVNLQEPTRREVLHEFGHVLGLIEEHQNPRANIPWNREAIYKELSGPPNAWSRSEIDRQIFRKESAVGLGPYRDFDADSVMNKGFVASWTVGVVLRGGSELSASDKALVARLYPR